jgi:NADH:ubiquinone oxidoreductase subunit 3 (subunit A)
LIAELTSVGCVLLISAILSLSALLLSKVSSVFEIRKSSANCTGSYECGFDNTEKGFTCFGENDGAVALYFVVELAVMWLFFCCSFIVFGQSSRGVVQNFSFVILFLIFAGYRAAFRKEKWIKNK